MEDIDYIDFFAEQGFASCPNNLEEKIKGYAEDSITLAEEKCHCEFLYKSYEGINKTEIPPGHLAVFVHEYGEPGTLPRMAAWLVRINNNNNL